MLGLPRFQGCNVPIHLTEENPDVRRDVVEAILVGGQYPALLRVGGKRGWGI
jgi:hypothetical protein